MRLFDMPCSERSLTTCNGRDAVIRHALFGMQFYDMPKSWKTKKDIKKGNNLTVHQRIHLDGYISANQRLYYTILSTVTCIIDASPRIEPRSEDYQSMTLPPDQLVQCDRKKRRRNVMKKSTLSEDGL